MKRRSEEVKIGGKKDRNKYSSGSEKRKKTWVWRSGMVANSHLQGGGKGDSRGAEATRSSDLGLMEVVVGGIGRGGRGGCGCQGRGSS